MTQSDDINSKNVQLIAQEAGLAACCIEQGLTAVRKADFVQQWHYYQAFFLLTIGIERLLKLTIVTYYRIRENRLPDNKELRDFGHNIEKLIENLTNRIDPNNKFLKSDDIYIKIIMFLSEYAKISRYYNLDSLSGSERTNDPLHIWKEIQDEIKKRHCKPIKLTPQEHFLVNSMNSISSINHSDEKGKSITNFIDFYAEGKNIDKIQGYSVYYLYHLISYITGLLTKISGEVYIMPVLEEFFTLFMYEPLGKQDIIRKKDWNYLSNRR